MELKDKLKQLRKDKGLTQAQLAQALFVSRSTVAKWENGLGLPGPDSMAALGQLFDISQEEVATTEPEKVIIEKNRRLYIIGQIVLWTAVLAITILTAILPFAIHNGDYGFTPEMAAGSYADDAYIDTGDYRIYYFQFEGETEDGLHWSTLQGWQPVQRHFWGCTVSEEDYSYRIITKNNYVVGRLYSIQGKNGYYNLLSKAGYYKAPEEPGNPMTWEIPAELITAATISIGGVKYELRDGFFFITSEPVDYFKIGDSWYDVIYKTEGRIIGPRFCMDQYAFSQIHRLSHRQRDTDAVDIIRDIPIVANEVDQVFSGNDMIAGFVQKNESFIIIGCIKITFLKIAPGDPYNGIHAGFCFFIPTHRRFVHQYFSFQIHMLRRDLRKIQALDIGRNIRQVFKIPIFETIIRICHRLVLGIDGYPFIGRATVNIAANIIILTVAYRHKDTVFKWLQIGHRLLSRF